VGATSAVLAAGAAFPASTDSVDAGGAESTAGATVAVGEVSTAAGTFPESTLTEEMGESVVEGAAVASDTGETSDALAFPASATAPVVESEASPFVEPTSDDATAFPRSGAGAVGATSTGAVGAVSVADDVSIVESVVPDATDGAVADVAPSVNSFPASVISKSGSFWKSCAGASNSSPVILLLIFAMMQFLSRWVKQHPARGRRVPCAIFNRVRLRFPVRR
jgi:hypothetical protein